jgi:serine/threonine protein kinase
MTACYHLLGARKQAHGGPRFDTSCAIGNRVGRYQVVGMIGQGQYSVVYRGHDPVLDRAVALKLPRAGALPAGKMSERLRGEGRALARLRHPAIIPVFELGQQKNQCFIAMALVEGTSLETNIQRNPRAIGVRRAAMIAADLADALDHVHAQGIVHRDVKPANVLLDHAGAVYLTDFGIASGPDVEPTGPAPGTLLGTPAYTAPEQADGGDARALPASDQYSLGVLFYELLCGRTPFSGPPLYVLFQAMNQRPPSPCEIAPTTPSTLSEICLKALATAPSDRYRSCADFAQHLRAWLRHHSP